MYDPLDNAIDKIKEVNKYDYLVICIDADEENILERQGYVQQVIADRCVDLGSTKLKVIVQNRCIETWLLGNRKIFNSKQPLEYPLSEYLNIMMFRKKILKAWEAIALGIMQIFIMST
ncbi:MAG: hypothetical protein AAGD25_03730 [Cyanobacteria bacterium P01_F01_bin.150]